MLAALLREVNRPLVFEEVNLDEPLDNEVLVDSVAAGVCHSEIHFLQGRLNTPLPAVLGHEVSGVVRKVGKSVNRIKKGDHVVACLSIFCGHCEFCLSGRPALCSRAGLRRSEVQPARITSRGKAVSQFVEIGGFSEQILVHESALVAIEKDIPLEIAALFGCAVVTGIGAVLHTAGVKLGETVAVVGCGGVGLNVVQGARIAGALKVIAIDTQMEKLSLAREFGATEGLLESESGLEDYIIKATKGGVDHAFEVVGKAKAVERCWRITRPGGQVTSVGLLGKDEVVNIRGPELMSEKILMGSNMGSNRYQLDIPRYIELWRQKAILIERLISKRIGLTDLNEAYRELSNGSVTRSLVMF